MPKTTTVKSPAKTVRKSSLAKNKKVSTTDLLEKASDDALMKLKELNIDEQLQADLEWCLGSYRHDKNPSGLNEVAGRALTTLVAEKEKKTKGITVKLIGELEKALKVQ